MEKHFVTFFSPGTLFSEASEYPIDSWDVSLAVEMSKNVVERYGATPYAFRFSTRKRNDDELDSRVVKQSGNYYLGGKIETYEEVESRNDPKEKILLSNMKINGWDRIVSNTKGYRWCQPLAPDDVVLEL